MTHPAEAFRAIGITYRQLDHWTSRGYLHADPRPRPGSGNVRTWPTEEVTIAQDMVRLIAAGVIASTAAVIARAGPGTYDLTPHVQVVLRG